MNRRARTTCQSIRASIRGAGFSVFQPDRHLRPIRPQTIPPCGCNDRDTGRRFHAPVVLPLFGRGRVCV
jgi:hypothetical protein